MLNAALNAQCSLSLRQRAIVARSRIDTSGAGLCRACDELADILGQMTIGDLGTLCEVLEGAYQIFRNLTKEEEECEGNFLSSFLDLVIHLIQCLRSRLLICEYSVLGRFLYSVNSLFKIMETKSLDWLLFLDQAKHQGLLDLIFRFLFIIPREEVSQEQRAATCACSQLLERAQQTPCSLKLAHILTIKRVLSASGENVQLTRLLEVFGSRFLGRLKVDGEKGLNVLMGIPVKFPPRASLAPARYRIPIAYVRYGKRSLPIGCRKYRGTVQVCPYNSSFEDRPWSLSGLLSFTGMLPDNFEGTIVKDHRPGPRQVYKWKLLLDNEKVGFIKSKDLDLFHIELTHFSEPLFEQTQYARKNLHIIFLPNFKDSSRLSRTLKTYCLRHMSESQRAQNSVLYRPRAIEPRSTVEVLSRVRGLKYIKTGARDELISGCWIAPWAASAIQHGGYFSLDASFYALRPYVYCVPHVVFCNTSIPLGLAVWTSESVELFSLFYDLLPESSREALTRLTCITDEGSALQSFLNDLKIRQVFCHRHMIQSFGSSGMLGALVRVLLKSSSQESFNRRRQYCNDVIMAAEQDGRTFDKIDKYWTLSCQVRVSKTLIEAKRDQSYLEKWALWCRGSVANTTNHVESFHRSLNHAVCPNGKKLGFKKSLNLVIEEVKKKYQKWRSYADRNLSEAFQKVNAKPWKGELSTCNCNFVREMSRRWDVPEHFPCAHIHPDKRKEMFTTFSKAVSSKLKELEKKLETNLDEELKVCHSNESPVFDMSKPPAPPSESFEKPVGRKETQLLLADEKKAVKLGTQIYPVFKTRVHLITIIEICRTVIQQHQDEPLPKLFVECYKAVEKRYACRSRK